MGGRSGGWRAGGVCRRGAGELGGCRVQAREGRGLGGGVAGGESPVSGWSPEWVVGSGKVACDGEDLG
ncbi:hypothetical protein TIFTF001_020535 [Ficus carica]|uniref:Uncharacterized protein n=1 Tax=Ficus carica TaxID=3494 RepID=A0AA88AG82_FICCA|nr:hypothetical protein TIFTF001_020535 [Ficus carica]